MSQSDSGNFGRSKRVRPLILVVDDDAVARFLYRQALEGEGFVILTRSGGHLSKLGMIRAEVMDGEYSTGIHG
jgi:CheY-like chemotaxis protein